MAHEITHEDGLVLTGQKAWHGLGLVVEEAPTPAEALRLANLDWEVELWPLTAHAGAAELPIGGYRAVVRSDTMRCFGVVSRNWTPIQNVELAQFAEELAEQGDVVKVESAGSVRGGARVWFLLRGDSFSIQRGDEIVPYILLANGHDGTISLRCLPTTVRVVCNNTLNMALSRHGGRIGFRSYHTPNIRERVEEAKVALGLYQQALTETKQLITEASNRRWTKDEVHAYFMGIYQKQFGKIPKTPNTRGERMRRTLADQAMREITGNFEKEEAKFGSSAWTAANAYTRWLQHKSLRGKDKAAAAERRLQSVLTGPIAAKTVEAFSVALSV